MHSRPTMRLPGVLRTTATAALLAVGAAGSALAAPVVTDPVVAWNATAGQVALKTRLAPDDNPLHESRMYAITHIAIHDAVNAIDRRSEPYALDLRVSRGASVEAAVASAARHALVPLLRELPADPTAIAEAVAIVERDYAAALGRVPDGAAERQGIAVGAAAAAVILAVRTDDGSDTPLVVPGCDAPGAVPGQCYEQGTRPGEYRFTEAFPFYFAPGWKDVTTFVLRDAAQYRSGPPYRLRSKAYARDLNEIKRLGGDGVTTPSARTADQTEIARFWVESSPLQWNRIARTLADQERLDTWQNARLFGLLNLAIADGYIGTWETKDRYRFWRPETAIRLADTDGNHRTTADPTWTPLWPTPPVPDHDSGHSVEGGAATAVFRGFFGTDRMTFEACGTFLLTLGCDSDTPTMRRFTSFTQAATENYLSRIYIGFHFRHAAEDGTEHGRKIGRRAVHRFLRPVR